MNRISFTTTGCWDLAEGFGCASLGLAGVCGNDEKKVVVYDRELEGVELTGTYEQLLAAVQEAAAEKAPHAAIVVFGNAGGENVFLNRLQRLITCPLVGGGAAIDSATGRAGLIPGGGDAAILLITDDRYTYTAETKCIHDTVLEECVLTLADPRTLLEINGRDAAAYYGEKRAALGLSDGDFEHLTLSDARQVNAHLSLGDGCLKSGRDLCERMVLRCIDHGRVYEAIRSFYDDPDAIVFGCAGLSGILDRPLDTSSLGLFLFGEVCTVDGYAEFGNLMLSKLRIQPR